MATYYAVKSGNINAADVWSTSPTGTASDLFPSFTDQDILVANGFFIPINVNTTVSEIRADTTGGATAGGYFYGGASGVTLRANINGVGNTGNGLFLGGSVSSFFIIGNITTGTTNCIRAATADLVLSINGNITGGSGSGHGINTEAKCTINVVGNITGGSSAGAGIFSNNFGTNINITGTITGGTATTGVGISVGTIGTTTITGNIVAATAPAISMGGASTISITGNVTGSSINTQPAITCGVSANGYINVTGTVTGGSTGNGIQNGNNGAVVMTIVGTAIGDGVAAINQSGNIGTVFLIRAKGGPLATSAVGINAGTAGAAVYVEEIEYGDLGASPTSGPIRLTNKSSNIALLYIVGSSKKTLIDSASTTLLPSASNVRSGTTYNVGQSTGTMIVPPATSVASGIAVDNTVGSAFLNPLDFWNYLTSAATTSNSIGERLKNCATTASISQQLSDSF